MCVVWVPARACCLEQFFRVKAKALPSADFKDWRRRRRRRRTRRREPGRRRKELDEKGGILTAGLSWRPVLIVPRVERAEKRTVLYWRRRHEIKIWLRGGSEGALESWATHKWMDRVKEGSCARGAPRNCSTSSSQSKCGDRRNWPAALVTQCVFSPLSLATLPRQW